MTRDRLPPIPLEQLTPEQRHRQLQDQTEGLPIAIDDSDRVSTDRRLRELFSAVGAKANLEPAFFDWWFDKAWDVPGIFTEEHARAVMRFYELSRDLGALKAFPDIRTLVSDQALTA